MFLAAYFIDFCRAVSNSSAFIYINVFASMLVEVSVDALLIFFLTFYAFTSNYHVIF